MMVTQDHKENPVCLCRAIVVNLVRRYVVVLCALILGSVVMRLVLMGFIVSVNVNNNKTIVIIIVIIIIM